MKTLSRRHKMAIDLGTQKISAWITSDLRTPESIASQGVSLGDFSLLGAGYVESRGISKGFIGDTQGLEKALISALYQAEQKARVQMRSANVVLSGGFFTSEYATLSVNIPHTSVTNADVLRLTQPLRQNPERTPIHIIPLEFSVDQQRHLANPVGVVGKELKGCFHVIWMDSGLFRTLSQCLKRCHVRIENIIHAGYANAMACLSRDERILGAVLCDIGFHAISLSFFHQDRLAQCALIPLGGHNITQDIARGCAAQLAHSERLKILYGAALKSPQDRRELLPLRPMDQGDRDSSEGESISRSFLTNIIQSRCEEMFQEIQGIFGSSPYVLSTQRLIFTGGTSQLPGMRELAQTFFTGLARIGRVQFPESFGLDTGISPDSLASIAGALLYQGTPLDFLFQSSKKEFNFFAWIKKNYDTIMNR